MGRGKRKKKVVVAMGSSEDQGVSPPRKWREEERNDSERERVVLYLQDVQDGKRAPPVVRATPTRRGITSMFRLPAAAVGAHSNKKQR